MAKTFATKLLSLIFIVAGVVAAQSAPSAPAQSAPQPAQSAKPPFDPNAPIQLMPAPSRKDTPAQLAPTRKSIPEIAKASNGAIVTIVMTNNDKPIARGTGFLVTQDGAVVTNYHVVANGNTAKVKFSDGTVLPVDGVLAADKVRDLAIIKIHGKNFPALTLGNSDRVQIGEDVVAIGNPLGLERTVSNGILSGVRTDKEAGGKFLQITAPITHGSSGGPLFNMMGEVVGITTLGSEGAGNLNFAIPINDAKNLLHNESATLRSLPNEAEESPVAEVPKTQEDPTTPQTCDTQAEKYARYKRQDYSHVIYAFKGGYTNHYDAKTNKCYVEVVLDYGPGKNPTTNVGWFSGRMYYIEDAAFEGEGGPHYGTFSKDEDHESCGIYPVGRPPVKCRSEEEFNELALKYFGIVQPKATMTVLPIGTAISANHPLPPNTKIAASAPDPEHATPAQILEDIRYCYIYPDDNLQDTGGSLTSCREINAGIQAQVTRCKTGPESKTESCKNMVAGFARLFAGRP